MKLFFVTDVHGSEICWKKFIDAVHAGELSVGCGYLPRFQHTSAPSGDRRLQSL